MRIRSTAEDYSGGTTTIAERPADDQRPIGELLLAEGVVTRDQLNAMVQNQAESGRLLGEMAIDMGLASQQQIDRIIALQQSYTLFEEGDARVDPAVVVATNPQDPLARSVRELRGVIASARRPDGKPVRSIALINLNSGFEAGLIAANLGVSCAQAGYRTRLVDADFETAIIHGLFRLPNRFGLSTVLSRGGDVHAAAQPTQIPRLSVLTSGPAVPNVAELLERERLFTRLRSQADAFDVILVNAGELIGSALHYLSGADGAVVTIRRDASSLRQLRDCSKHLSEAGVAVLGAAFVA